MRSPSRSPACTAIGVARLMVFTVDVVRVTRGLAPTSWYVWAVMVGLHTWRPTGPASGPACVLHEVISPPPAGTTYVPELVATWTVSNPELQVTAPAADPITVAAKAALGETTIAISAIDDAMTPARALGRNLLALPKRMRPPQGAAMDTAG